MFMIAKLLGIIILVMGVIFLLDPKVIKKYASFWLQGKRIYAGAIVNILFGIMFFSIASQCAIPAVLVIMGVISLIKGIVLLVLGPEKVKAKLNWWTEMPAGTVRILAIIVIAIGALLIYSV